MDPPALPLGLTTGATTLNPTTANAIDTHMREIASLRDPLLGCSQGDVLAIVRFPRDDSAVACDTRPWQDVRLLMRYEQLVGLGSNKIRAMFTPRAQARFRRLLGGEPLAPGVEYVVDFTPPTEGLELAELTAALWLPKMVKLWFLAGQYMPEPILGRPMDQPMRPMANKAVGSILALGHDDVCKSPSCLADFSEWQVKDGLPGIVDENPALGPSHIPPFRKVEDYCPIRHRVAIVRVLRAVNGHGLLLNSAVRMWTVAQVAIYLEVPQVVVDPVTQWLVAPPNTKFIEICPEKAFQLAYALKIPSVLIASFKILVNELAIDYAASEPSPRRQPLTWAQRRRDDYGDYPSDPVEYASRAFAERMSAMLRMLLSDDVFDKLPQRIPEWDKLQYLGSLIDAHGPDVLRTSYQNLTASLLAAFHKSVQVALGFESFTSQLGPLIEAQRKHYIADADRTRLEALYTQLNPCQKALTPFFWDQLMWTPTETEFCATVDNGRQLRRHASSFNTLLRSALDNGTIVPDQTHPSLQPAAYPVSREPDLEFNLVRLHGSLRAEVKAICAHILRNNLRDSDSNGVPFFLSDHLLLALDEPELNYLPIWADGLEDGSGGVFQEAIPPAEMGPSELGPGYHTGCTVGTETETATDADDADTTRGCGGATSQAGAGGGYDYASTIALSDLGVGVLALGDDEDDDHMMDGTVAASATAAGRSMRAHRSTTTTAATTTTTTTTGAARSGAAPSETFTADDGSSVYADARFAEPAAHQAQGQAIEQYVAEAEGSGAWMGEDDEDGFAGDSDEEMGFSDDGSSTLDGFEELDFAEEP